MLKSPPCTIGNMSLGQIQKLIGCDVVLLIGASLSGQGTQSVFFRAASNRRQTTYWSSDLNSDLPLTTKDDVTHKDTFMAHDLGHFTIVDLIFTDIHFILHWSAYIAMTIMLLIDALSKAFTKWIGVQLTIASTFHWLTESEQLRSKIIAQLSTYTDGNKGGQISYTLNQTFLNG
ncbi:unnamed protein product [Rotaria sp. Silwood1]|nr:unnamed protein product [Rotaria sp. Silwood1]CAF1548691.1 unnamed protein product [Rotaria sp. Silwood1]